MGGARAGAARRAQDLVRAFVRSVDAAPRWPACARGGGAGGCAAPEGGELAELVDDRVSVLQRGRVADRFREIEIEGRGIEREGAGADRRAC